MNHADLPYTLWQSLIFTWTFWMSVTLGCYGLVLLHHTVRGSWGYPVLRIAEAGSKLIFPMGLVYLAIFFLGKEAIYPWSHPGSDPVLVRKASYMNWAWIRTLIYCGIWALTAWVVNSSSKRQDQTGDVRETQKRTNISAPSLVFFVILLTFAFTDWVMSLEAHWYSTIYGFLFLADSGLAALAFVTMVALRHADREPYKSAINRSVVRDLGNLLLTFTMVWAYFNLSQFLIQWSGNLPEEASYYVNRNSDVWRWLGAFLICGQFFLPFLLLLSNRTKRTPSILLNVARWIFFVRILDIFWMTVPTFRPSGPSIEMLYDLGVFVVFGAIWLGAFSLVQKQNALFPKHAPYVPPQAGEVLEHAS
jgi:hypothetical protein